METESVKAKPFLKWAGGKGQLLTEIQKYYPFADKKITKYAEPFIGGGAVLFDVLNRYDLSEVYISDINAELVNCYWAAQQCVEELIQALTKMQDEYLPLNHEKRREYYTEKRARFNELKNGEKKKGDIEKAALMIFLNRTCFNGLFRVNKKGQFNVPMGAYKNPIICDAQNLRAVSQKLKAVKIVCGDYKKSEVFVDENTFVYFDPPYRPLTETSNFTSYTESQFDDNKQIELAQFAKMLDARGAKIVISNSDPKNENAEDDFFDTLYSAQRVHRVEASRMINCNKNSRGKIKELLITNFERQGSKENASKQDRERSEKKMEKREFKNWMASFKESIADYGYYVDFDKVYRNVNEVKVELNILNSLIGVPNIEEEFENLIRKYPDVLKCIPLLLAVREKEIYCQDEKGGQTYKFTPKQMRPKELEPEKYAYFMEHTGLFDLLKNHIIRDLVDYVTGVETGLDSNGRKNRGGHLMEDLVEGYIKKAGFVKDKTYFKEMYIHQIAEKWGLELSAISNQGKMEKRFDFVVKTGKMVYGIETNFYGSQGSKLNETARSYKTLALEANTIQGFTFVWFTDGKGWSKAKHNLEETFDVMEHIYSIQDMENGIISEVFQ